MSNFCYKHGGNLHQEAQRLGVKLNDLLDASASIVPFNSPRSLRRCLRKAISTYSLRNYPDRTHTGLKQAISKWHEINPEMVLPGNGASELFTWAAKDASQYGISGIPSPGFSDYERALRCWGAKYIHTQLPLSWNKQKIHDFPLTPESDVLWITNPHNPTGQLWSRESIEPLINHYKFIICDAFDLDKGLVNLHSG